MEALYLTHTGILATKPNSGWSSYRYSCRMRIITGYLGKGFGYGLYHVAIDTSPRGIVQEFPELLGVVFLDLLYFGKVFHGGVVKHNVAVDCPPHPLAQVV